MSSKTTIEIKRYPDQPVIKQSGSTAVVAGTRPGATMFTIGIPSEHGDLAWVLESALLGMSGICSYCAPWQVKVIVTAEQSTETIRQMIEHVLTREGIEFEVIEEK